MMKAAKTVIVVDSVEKAIKFYTEKLGFDLIDASVDKESDQLLNYAELKKGKCHLLVRLPSVEELAEFSMIKRCTGRGVGVLVELKKGIEVYFARCVKKGLAIVSELRDEPSMGGVKAFSLKDPFGMRFTVIQPNASSKRNYANFCGHKLATGANGKFVADNAAQEAMIQWLKGFGVLRRVSKKFSKLWLKQANEGK